MGGALLRGQRSNGLRVIYSDLGSSYLNNCLVISFGYLHNGSRLEHLFGWCCVSTACPESTIDNVTHMRMSHGRMSHEIAPHTPQRKNREHLLANSRQLTSTFTATTNPMSNVNMGEASGAHETPTASPGSPPPRNDHPNDRDQNHRRKPCSPLLATRAGSYPGSPPRIHHLRPLPMSPHKTNWAWSSKATSQQQLHQEQHR